MIVSLFFNILTLLIITVFILSRIDYKKKRKQHKNPAISYLIPCYNDGDTIKKTIESIYDTAKGTEFELIVINDKSKDNSKEMILEIQKKYQFIFVDMEVNSGKAAALNSVIPQIKYDTIVFIDADTLLNKKSLEDMLNRLETNPKVGAVTCPYRPINRGFLPFMQWIEYNMAKIMTGAHNVGSAFTMRGGCITIRKEAFIKAGLFSINAISEDMDLSLKLHTHGYKVQQSFYSVETLVPDTAKSLYKQKIRRSSGGMQCMIKYFKVRIRNPTFILFSLFFSVSMMIGSYYFIKNMIVFGHFLDFIITLIKATSLSNGADTLKQLYGDGIIIATIRSLAFTGFAIPYIIPTIKRKGQRRYIASCIPFALIYAPIFGTIRTYGFVIGVYKYFVLKEGTRAR